MTKLLGVLTLALLLPATLPAAAQDKSDGAKAKEGKDSNPFIGRYKFIGGEKDGAVIAEDRLKDSTVAINADTIAVLDRDKKEVYTAKYTLSRKEDDKSAGSDTGAAADKAAAGKAADADKNVWLIDMESKSPQPGSKAVGLIKRDGKQVWLIYDLTGKRPESFDKTEKHQHLFKLARTSKEPTLDESAPAE